MKQTTHAPAAHWLKVLLAPFIALPTLVLALTLITWAAEPQDFGHPTNLSASHSLISGAPAMAAADNTLAVAWVEELSGTTLPVGNQGFLYLQTGQTYWQSRVTVHTGTVNALATDPALIFDRSNSAKMHLVWTEGRLEVAGSSNQYFYQKINYTTCTISGDVNACQPTANIVSTANTGLSFRNPTLAQDDQGNLHVVWTEERNSQLYYQRWDKAGGLWGPSSLISQASNAQNPKLDYSNGRLHLIWDNKAANQINYIYDNYPGNNVFTADGAWQFIPDDNFINGDPGNATLTTDNNNYVFVAFDIRKFNTNNTFALVYAQSDNNGSSWSSFRDIPDQSDGNFYSYPSNTENVTGGLRPSLALTATGGITYLHVVWHNNQERDSGDNTVYEIYHAYRPVSSDDTFNTPWLPTTPLTVTNPPGAAGILKNPPTPSSMRKPAARDNFRITGLMENDSVMPVMAITNPAGKGNLHLAYLERLSTNQPWNVYYRGFIAGTVDPAYIQNPASFELEKTVAQTSFFVSEWTASQNLGYMITITNKGDLEAIGVGITDTFISGAAQIQFINDDLSATIAPLDDIDAAVPLTPALSMGQDQKSFTWYGNIPPQRAIRITFSALTTEEMILPQTIQNRVQLWTSGSGGKPIERISPPFNNIATTTINQTGVVTDPGYIQNPSTFSLEKTVAPTNFWVDEYLEPQTLAYVITITNKGELDAVGVGITDTFTTTTQINQLEAGSLVAEMATLENPGALVLINAQPALLAGTKSFSWYGTVPAESFVRISFNAITNQLTPQIVQNLAQLWHHHSQGRTLLADDASVYINQSGNVLDPEYIKDRDNFDIAKKVDQTVFHTVTPIGPLTLNYNITITNSGVLTTVGLGITDTFISGLNYIDNINTLVATIGPITGSKVTLTPAPSLNGNAFTWRGNIPAGHVLNISFRALTKEITPIQSIRNRVQVWNSGSMGEPIERVEPPFNNIATTTVTQYRVMLPLISKK